MKKAATIKIEQKVTQFAKVYLNYNKYTLPKYMQKDDTSWNNVHGDWKQAQGEIPDDKSSITSLPTRLVICSSICIFVFNLCTGYKILLTSWAACDICIPATRKMYIAIIKIRHFGAHNRQIKLVVKCEPFVKELKERPHQQTEK